MDTKLTYSLNGKMVAEMSTQDEWLDREVEFENIVNEFQQHVGKQCKITGRNIGWRRTSVQHEFTMTEATTFLYMLLPNSEYNLKLYREFVLANTGIAKYRMDVYTHDNPVTPNQYIINLNK